MKTGSMSIKHERSKYSVINKNYILYCFCWLCDVTLSKLFPFAISNLVLPN